MNTQPRELRVVAERAYRVTSEMVRAYADVSGDRNTIHLSDDAARQRGFAGAIAHGHILLAFVSDLMAQVDPRWFAEGGLESKFRRPVSCDEQVLVRVFAPSTDEALHGNFTFECINSAGEPAAVGTARIGKVDDGS